MTERDIEKKVQRAFTNNAPNVLDNILSECGKQEGKVINMSERKSNKRIIKWATGIAAMFALLIMGAFGVRFYQINYDVDSIISLDVNPSIEIKTNQKEQVLAVNALNEDGKIVIGDMSFKGSNLDVTINALIGSMLRNGYLNEAANSILVSVCGDDSEKSSALQEKLIEEINAILQTDAFSGAVLSQTVTADSELEELADTYGISLGKAQLIQQFISQDPQYSFEDLAGLTINELNIMIKTNGLALEDVSSTGSVSDKSYIGIDNAKAVAFSDAGVTSTSSISKLEIEMDHEHDIMIYEVSFLFGNNKYNYDINAVTGEIMESKISPEKDKDDDDKEQEDKGDKNTSFDTSNYIGESAAKSAALSYTNLSSSEITQYEWESYRKGDTAVYKIIFAANGYQHICEVDAFTGSVLEYDSHPVH